MDSDKTAVFGIVAFPSLDERDRMWVDSIRAKHDPQVERIASHFTLVFPTVLSSRVIEAQAARVAAVTEPIRFVLRRAAVFPEPNGVRGHIFLVPEEGRDQLVQLHDRLYDGVLQPHLRKEVSFVPHITLGTRSTLDQSHDLAAEVNATSRPVRGYISEIVLVEVTPAAIEAVEHFQLGPA